MSKITALILCITLFSLVQIVTWFQLNGQFVWPWFKNNMLLVCLMGIPISWFYIEATRYGFIAFEGILWPGRLLGFATGIFCFTLLTYIFMNEVINLKTAVILLLATVIVLLQVFWKTNEHIN